MEQILDNLQIDWVKAQLPLEDVTAEVIYFSRYISFTLSKIPSEVGDLYRLTMPYPVVMPEHSFLLNKLASAGLRFVFNNSNIIYQIDPERTLARINAELHPTFTINGFIQYYGINADDDVPTILDDCLFEMMEETINDFREGDSTNLHQDVFDLSEYIEHCETVSDTHFSTGNRWINIAMIFLSIAKISVRDHDFITAAIILYSFNSIIKRFGATADIAFLRNLNDFAEIYTANNSPNLLLKRSATTLLSTILSHNRIFYQI